MNSQTGVMLCGHGSRDAGAALEFAALVKDVALCLPQFRVESGFLEFSTPSIPDGLEALKRKGCAQILAVPGTLFSAGHAQNDIPALLKKFSADNPEIKLTYGRELGADPKMARAAIQRVQAAIASLSPVDPEHTALLVVARGASSPAALSATQAITDMMQNELKFSHAITAYAGMAHPLIAEGLSQATHFSVKRLIIMPYFLFTGRLVNDLYALVETCARANPQIEFVKAQYLNNHPLVVECFVDRIAQTAETGIRMNG